MRSIMRNPFFRRIAIAAVATVVVLAAAAVSYFSRTQAAPAQPMPFPHVRMVANAGVQCIFCHTTATVSPAPGMPSLEKCMGCHKMIATDRPAIKQLAQYWQDQKPIEWVRINQIPRHVKFPHNVHVTAGALNCENCHGDVGHMDVTHQVANINMGWCLSCHQTLQNSRALIDCVICHY